MEFEAWLEEPWCEELPALGEGVESGGEIGAAGAEGEVTTQSGHAGTGRPSGHGTDPEPLAAAWPDVHQENNDDLAALDLSIRRVDEHVSGGLLYEASDGHGTSASWASSGQEVRRGGSLQPFEPIAVGDGPPAGTLPRAPNSEPGTPPPSPVPAEAVNFAKDERITEEAGRGGKRRRDDAPPCEPACGPPPPTHRRLGPSVQEALGAASLRQLTVDEVAALLTAPAETLRLTARPGDGTQAWALHLEHTREPRNFGMSRKSVRTCAYPLPRPFPARLFVFLLELDHVGDLRRISGATAAGGRARRYCGRPTPACPPSLAATGSSNAARQAPRRKCSDTTSTSFSQRKPPGQLSGEPSPFKLHHAVCILCPVTLAYRPVLWAQAPLPHSAAAQAQRRPQINLSLCLSCILQQMGRAGGAPKA